MENRGLIIFVAIVSIGLSLLFLFLKVNLQILHPCIEQQVERVCIDATVCGVGGILPIPGFRNEETKTYCHYETYCTKRK